jgi:hypothetical protein
MAENSNAYPDRWGGLDKFQLVLGIMELAQLQAILSSTTAHLASVGQYQPQTAVPYFDYIRRSAQQTSASGH